MTSPTDVVVEMITDREHPERCNGGAQAVIGIHEEPG
jgi:hypothetical protein